jgi:hypothetical protein
MPAVSDEQRPHPAHGYHPTSSHAPFLSQQRELTPHSGWRGAKLRARLFHAQFRMCGEQVEDLALAQAAFHELENTCTISSSRSELNHFPIRTESLMPSFRHVTYSWDDAKAAALDPVGRLIYRSNILGADQRITNTGGGNTSARSSRRTRSPARTSRSCG